ncbi:MAG TPA: transcriptional activator NhaR [Tepidisphaeraceae bacterium]|jgi:LysR family transcriptional activator of nhaA|nr:transcriptional activator NhaR [Tepidisphaeraceae bacterium]
MDWLNYHHLMYFWAVARHGGIAAASRELAISEPTISGQVKELERALGERLFTRSGRRLVLTDVGKVVYDYASEISSLGRELLDTVKQRPTNRPLRLAVGIADALPKLVARTLLEPALRMGNVHLICREGRLEELLVELSSYRLDLVLSDQPAGESVKVKSFSQLLGESGVSFFASAAVARKLSTDAFPALLSNAPLILPTEHTALRRALDAWFSARGVSPLLRAEVQDSALLKTFGQSGFGVFPAPSIVEADVCEQYGVAVVGRTDEARERFYAISVERKLRHPAVVAIIEGARAQFTTFATRTVDRGKRRTKRGKR